MTLPELVEEVESVGGEEAQEVVRDVQHSESVMVAATSEGELEHQAICDSLRLLQRSTQQR